jgi:hypothetical protein
MTDYNLTRYEKNRDSKGTITSIYLAVSVKDDGGNSRTQEYWLSAEEIADVGNDGTTINKIIEQVAAEGAVVLEDWVAVAPLPPIIMPVAGKTISKTNVSAKIEAIKKKRTDVKPDETDIKV